MEIESGTAIKYIAYLAVLAAAIGLEHMAFRTPQWRQRELMRRAIGDGTVLVLFALFIVLERPADFVIWLMIVGGFAVAAAVKLVANWHDDTRRAAIIGRLQHGGEGED